MGLDKGMGIGREEEWERYLWYLKVVLESRLKGIPGCHSYHFIGPSTCILLCC